MPRIFILFLLISAACTDKDSEDCTGENVEWVDGDCVPKDDNDTGTDEIDLDGDGVLADFDCDDTDAELGAVSEDQDCDGALTDIDCDDTDPELGSELYDADCDGVFTEDDCDDAKAIRNVIGSHVACLVLFPGVGPPRPIIGVVPGVAFVWR